MAPETTGIGKGVSCEKLAVRRVRQKCSSQNIGSGDCPTEAERMPVPVGSIEGIECARPLSAVAVSGLLIGDYMGSISWSLASSGTVAATSLVGHQSVLTSHAFPHSRRHHSRSGIREIENAVLMKWEAATSCQFRYPVHHRPCHEGRRFRIPSRQNTGFLAFDN